MKKLKPMMVLCLTSATLFVASCKKEETKMEPTPTPTPAPMAPEASLYTRLGGIDAISAVTDQFLNNVAADNVINAQFAATVANPYRLKLLRNNLIDQICAGSGGPCQYKGKTMLESHKGMNITNAQFSALVGDLVASLDMFSVPEKEKNDLLAILGPMQSDIVGH
jgi:hemoglobin